MKKIIIGTRGSKLSISYANEVRSLILKNSKNLDIDIKTAFTLREIDGRSYEEIARIMECPIGTVRSRIFRARQLIVDFINQENI